MANIPKTLSFKPLQLEALIRIAARPDPKHPWLRRTWADVVRIAVDVHISKHAKVSQRPKTKKAAKKAGRRRASR